MELPSNCQNNLYINLSKPAGMFVEAQGVIER